MSMRLQSIATFAAAFISLTACSDSYRSTNALSNPVTTFDAASDSNSSVIAPPVSISTQPPSPGGIIATDATLAPVADLTVAPTETAPVLDSLNPVPNATPEPEQIQNLERPKIRIADFLTQNGFDAADAEKFARDICSHPISKSDFDIVANLLNDGKKAEQFMTMIGVQCGP